MKQTSYTYRTPHGAAGSLYDISPYSIDSRVNGEESNDAMLFGMGVVVGDAPGQDVVVPKSTSTIKEFEGVAMTGYTQEMFMNGQVDVRPAQIVGVLRWGKP